MVLEHKGPHAPYCFGLDELNPDSENSSIPYIICFPMFNQGKGCTYLLKTIPEFPVDRW